MKKFISFVMAAAMVASLVPATAFAKGEVTARAKVIDAIDSTKDEAKDSIGWITEDSDWATKVPELQLTITSTDYRDTNTGADPTVDVTLSLDNAVFAQKSTNAKATTAGQLLELVKIIYDDDAHNTTSTSYEWSATTGTAGAKPAVRNPQTSEVVLKADYSTFANTAAGQEDFLKWAIGMGATVDLSGMPDTWLDTTPADDTDDATTQKPIVADNAFVAPYTANDFIHDVLNQPAANFVNAATGSTTVNLNTAALKVGTDVTRTADNWNANPDAAAVTAVYTDLGWVEGEMKPVQSGGASPIGGIKVSVVDFDEDEVTYRFTGKFAVDDIILFDLCSQMDKTGVGRTATVSVSSKMVEANDLTYIGVKSRGITATTKKVGSIAEEEIIGLEGDIKISSTVGDFIDTQWFEVKLSKGFEFDKFVVGNSKGVQNIWFDGNTAYFQFDSSTVVDQDTITIDKDSIDIESTSAKSGSTCTMTVKATDDVYANGERTGAHPNPNTFNATATVEVLKVVDYKVILSVDEDEDIPVIYSGVNVDNYGITDDSDHMSLEVTAKESFPGAWSMRKGFNFELPEHVYVTDVDVVDTDNFYRAGKVDNVTSNVETEDVKAAFWNAYQDGKHVNFEFAKRVFDDVDSGLRDRECAEMTFKLELVADPGFEGDVVLKLTGELVDEQEVTIAKFVKPYEVKAEQNDLKIDYRYTDIPTDITLTEAEKGLWAKNEATFYLSIEKGIDFDSDPTFEIDSKSGLEIKDDKVNGGTIQFTIKSESDEAATITIKDMDLYMERNIPAGPYDLKIGSSLANYYEGQTLWAPDDLGKATQDANGASDVPTDNIANEAGHNDDACSNKHGAIDRKADTYVGCVADYSKTVKEAFVNVITAGREVDDASFTTKVVVPVGESYIVAGEKQIELDTPAYINEAGYTMLPIRAVATALGINNNNVLWDQPTKTVTILYGQRIITMTQGQKVVYVNGSAIPASAAVENTNSRTFLPMRDLATALGVTDITWDQATRTATLNGNQTTSAK